MICWLSALVMALMGLVEWYDSVTLEKTKGY